MRRRPPRLMSRLLAHDPSLPLPLPPNGAHVPTSVDLDNTVTVTGAINPATQATNATVNGSSVDLSAAGYRDPRVLLVAGLGSRTDGSFTFSLEQSDDDSSYTALSPFSGSLAAVAAANTRRTASYVPTKRYVRAKSVSTAVTTGAIHHALVVLLPPSL